MNSRSFYVGAALALLLLATGCSPHGTTMAITKQGSQRWVTNIATLKEPGRRDLPKTPLQEIGRAERDDARFTWLAPENGRELPDRAMALGSLDAHDEVISKFLWEEWDWVRSVLGERFPDADFDHAQVDVVVAAPGLNLKRRFRAALKPREIRFTVGVALNQEAPDLARFDMVLLGGNTAAHELLHFVADQDGYFGLDYANMTSEEAAAHTFAACSAMAIGRYPATNVLSDWALTPEWGRERMFRPSKTILKDSGKQNGYWTARFEPSARGAVLATVGIQEALGGRESIGKEDLPMLDRYCRAAIDPAIDWKRERPCQTRQYRGLCQPPKEP